MKGATGGPKDRNWWARPLTFLALYGLYLLFVYTPDKVEFLSGLAVTLFATVGAIIFRVGEAVRFCPSKEDVLQCWRIPGAALAGCYQLFKALTLHLLMHKRVGSSIRAVPFPVMGSDSQSTGRRILAEWYTTMTPNSIVLGYVHQQRLLLLHQIVPGKVLRLTLNLGARS